MSLKLYRQLEDATCSCHSPRQSAVCERTWGMLERGVWEEADWRSAGGEETPVVLLWTPEPICSMVKRRSQNWHGIGLQKLSQFNHTVEWFKKIKTVRWANHVFLYSYKPTEAIVHQVEDIKVQTETFQSRLHDANLCCAGEEGFGDRGLSCRHRWSAGYWSGCRGWSNVGHPWSWSHVRGHSCKSIQ